MNFTKQGENIILCRYKIDAQTRLVKFDYIGGITSFRTLQLLKILANLDFYVFMFVY